MTDNDDRMLTILCEINNRLNDIALTLQTIGLMETSVDSKQELYKFLCGFLDVQKLKYRSLERLSMPYNPLTGSI